MEENKAHEAAEVAPSTPVENDGAQPPQSSMGLMGVIVLIVVIVVGGWFLLKEDKVEALSAEEIFANASTEMKSFFDPQNPISVSFEGEVLADVVGADGRQELNVVVDLGLSGAINVDENKDLSIQTEINIEKLKYNLGNIINFNFGSPDIELRFVGDSMYMLATDFDDIDLLDISVIEGKWMEIAQPGFQSNFQRNIDRSLSQGLSNEALFDMFSSVEEMGVDKVRGVQSYHYRVALENEVKGLMPAGTPVDVWIGAEDFLLRKISFVIDPNGIDQNDFKGNVTVELEMFDYGDSVDVEIPKDATPYEQLLNEAFAG